MQDHLNRREYGGGKNKALVALFFSRMKKGKNSKV